MTCTVAEEIDFWRHDPRGIEERIRTQSICCEAFEHQLRLNDVEKRILVNITNCSARDAMVFWHWLENNCAAYFAMRACISLLDKLGSKNAGHRFSDSPELTKVHSICSWYMLDATMDHALATSPILGLPRLSTSTSRFGSISFINGLNVCGMGMLGFGFCICFVLLHSRVLKGFGLIFGLV